MIHLIRKGKSLVRVTIKYFGQLRRITELESEECELKAETTVEVALATLAGRYGTDYGSIVLSEGGGLRPSVIVVVNGATADKKCPPVLNDGDEVLVFSPIAGG